MEQNKFAYVDNRVYAVKVLAEGLTESIVIKNIGGGPKKMLTTFISDTREGVYESIGNYFKKGSLISFASSSWASQSGYGVVSGVQGSRLIVLFDNDTIKIRCSDAVLVSHPKEGEEDVED